MQKPRLVAIDTNIVLALGGEDADTLDTLQLIRQRSAPVQILLCPTVLMESSHLSVHGDDEQQGRLATDGFRQSIRMKFLPSRLNAVQEAIAEQAAAHLTHRGLIPASEHNDACILAEAAVLNCVLPVSNDSHLHGLDYFQTSLALREFDLAMPVISTPRELLRKFHF